MLKGAIIGLGNIAVRGHVPAYRADAYLHANVEIIAVMDIVEQNREKVREYLPRARFYTNIQDMLSQESIDFADICTPPHTHADYINACAEKKIHLICEKPLTHSPSLSDGLVKTIRTADILFMPCHQYKHAPLWKSIREIVTSGGVGKVTFAQFNVFRVQADSGTAAWNPEWRTHKEHSGGGILVDTGAHYLYLVPFIFGMPRKLTSVLRTLKHAEYSVEDTAIVTMEYDDKLVQVNLTWAANARANSVWITGTEGTLAYSGSTLRHSFNGITRELPVADVADKQQYIDWYASLFREFVLSVEHGDKREDGIDEAAAVMNLIDLSYRASKQQVTLEIL